MMRAVLTFFSTLAFAVMAAATLFAVMPWMSGRTSAAVLGGEGGLHFNSLLFGVILGLVIGTLGRYNWGDIPRRMVTWVLIRERQFFYYVLTGGCVAVLLFY